eukprot:TRINITY_DN35264_c0_g1_i1.p1 TRINITY_DN35264_c0_g1~~TRINITY_DN35264_c0_g1_i1.p1  ORF type:complete len:176 (+),score=36.55 TRINITY_DN35264_c0_g1_i1:105-632(+)
MAEACNSKKRPREAEKTAAGAEAEEEETQTPWNAKKRTMGEEQEERGLGNERDLMALLQRIESADDEDFAQLNCNNNQEDSSLFASTTSSSSPRCENDVSLVFEAAEALNNSAHIQMQMQNMQYDYEYDEFLEGQFPGMYETEEQVTSRSLLWEDDLIWSHPLYDMDTLGGFQEK